MVLSDPRISVLMFANAPIRGGAEEHMLMLLRYLDRSKFQLKVACGPELAESIRKDLPEDVTLLDVPFSRFSDIRGGARLHRLLREHDIKILHSHMFWSSLFASPVGWFSGTPVIVETPHVREEWRKGWKASYRIDRLAGRFVNKYIAVSYANARYLQHEKGIPAEKIVVIQNGCDLSRFSANHQAPPGLKHNLGFAADDPVLLVAARLEEQKGHRVLLNAMPRVLQQFPATRLICIGDGILRSSLENQIQELGLSSAVRILGYQSNVQDWLAVSDISVLPSFYEGLPLVAIEALASGKPVVATAVDGTPEVVIDGKTGLLVPAGDPGRLAEAICRLLGDTILRLSLAAAGPDFVRRRFSRERQVRETEDCYLSLLGDSSGEPNKIPIESVSASEAVIG